METIYYTPKEVAERLKLRVQTIYDYIRKGRLPVVRLGNRCRIAEFDPRLTAQEPAPPAELQMLPLARVEVGAALPLLERVNPAWSGALATFPPSEVAWMLASPIATLAILIGIARTIARLPLSSRALRYESWLGIIWLEGTYFV